MWNWPWPDSILQGPAAVSPDGNYNLEARPPRNTEAYALIGVCIAITTVGALLRAYSRIVVNKKVHVEDYLALFALFAYITFVWSMVAYVHGSGLFVHQWDIRAGNMFELAVYLFVFSVMDPIWCIPAKAAILLEWKRIFVPRGTRNMFWWTAWFLLSLNSLFYFIAFFFLIFANQPIAKNWDVLLPGSSPYDRKTIDIVAAALNVFVDSSIFLLPQPVIWSLHMTKSRKISLCLMFSMGLLSVGCAAGRLYATTQTVYPWPVIGDTSYTISNLWLWYIAELTSANIVMFAPSVPKAFSDHTPLGRLLNSFRSWTSSLSSKSRTSIAKTWPRTIGGARDGRLHRLKDEDGQAMGLADMKLMQAAQKDYGDTMSTDFSQATTILRTIEVDQQEDAASKVSLDPTQQRQHPWMDV